MATAVKISITTGDVDGVGLEIAEKALCETGPQKGVHLLLWRSPRSYPASLSKLKKYFNVASFTSPEDALAFLNSNKMSEKHLVEIVSSISPAHWVEITAQWCFSKKIHGMVTGPLSKSEIYNSGLTDMGHTDILKRVSGEKNVFMGFIGKKFNVVLATAHIPLSKVTPQLTSRSLLAALGACDQLRQLLPKRNLKQPIGVLGLNPHAGERGLIGSDEDALMPQLFNAAKSAKIPVVGPLVPDAAFQPKNWKNISVYLAMYHDQGLIPFKLVHGSIGGVHISLGLPFVRTSVDHGTAKDIFKKNRANPSSMREAIQTCIKLTKTSIR